MKNVALGGQVKFMEFGCTTSTHLHAFLTWDPYPNVCHLYHANIIGTITLWDRKKGEKHTRSKEMMQTLQINIDHSRKQTHPSKYIPCLQVTWKLVKQKLNVASHCHQDEFQIQYCLKILHAMASFWTHLSFLHATHSTFNFPDITCFFQHCTCCFSILFYFYF